MYIKNVNDVNANVDEQQISEIIKEVKEREREEFKQLAKEAKKGRKWDILESDNITFFDTNLSYELTGYRPINKTQGLDFDPDPFLETRNTFLRTGHYTQYTKGTKAYADFWDEEYRRCINGYTIGEYTITGDHYFFLNYYQLMDLDSAQKAGSGREYAFPTFYVGQYEWFHYVELAKRLRLNAFLMKSREVGYSEIDAAILANSYNSVRNSINLVTAHSQDYLDKTLEKVWRALNFLDDYTDGGFRKLRQVVDTQYKKRSSAWKMVNGSKIESGWKSQIQGIVADKPNKIRGDRVDLLIYEECGSWPSLDKAFIQSNALVGQPGRQWGYRIGGGTGGDDGPALSSLRDMYYKPSNYGILPYKHNNTADGQTVFTAFFIPCTKIMKYKGFYDKRGFVDPDKAREYWDEVRKRYSTSPRQLIIQCAEYCYTAEEAFSLEGDNSFDKTILAEQLANIRLMKTCPKIETGTLSYVYKNADHKKENITGYRWDENLNGKVHILEHPMWSDLYKQQQEQLKIECENKGIQYEPTNYDTEYSNLYIAGIDSIDIGGEDTSEATDDPSKFCIIIFKRAFGLGEPYPVAYYMDRPDHIRDAYKIAMCLVTYYQAIVNLEATRMNILAWAREHGYYHHFMMRPKATYPDPTKINRRTPGTPATPTIIQHQLQLIEAYIEDYGHHIWFEELLDELSRYSFENKTKYDMVAAFGMVMLANEELGDIAATKIFNNKDTTRQLNIGYYIDDKGYKHFGAIPFKKQEENVNFVASDQGARSSDPRKWASII